MNKKGFYLTERKQENTRDCKGSKQEGEYGEGHWQTDRATSMTGLGLPRQTGT